MKKITLFLLSTCMFTGIKNMEQISDGLKNLSMDVENDVHQADTPIQQNRKSSKEKRVKSKHNQDSVLLAALEKNNDLLERNNALLRLNVITPYLIFRYNNYNNAIINGKVADPEFNYNEMKRIDGEFAGILELLDYPKEAK